MYITCPQCKAKQHISLWKRLCDNIFKCPQCGKEINMEGRV